MQRKTFLPIYIDLTKLKIISYDKNIKFITSLNYHQGILHRQLF